LVLLLLLLAAIGLSQAATPSSPLLAEDIRAKAMQVSRRADVFVDMLTRMGGVDRVELASVTDETVARMTAIREQFDAIEDPPPDLIGVITLFDLALEYWTVGVEGFRDHLLTAADGESSLGLTDLVVDDLLALRTADQLYAQAVVRLSEAEVTQPVSPMPVIRFLPVGYPVAPGAHTLVAQAEAPGSPLALDAALVIDQVTTLPEWVLDTEGTLVLDAIDELVVRVVVSNAGNAPSEPRGVAVEVVGGDGSAQNVSTEVPSLAAGSKTTVTFDPIAVTPGRSYSMIVRLALALGEGDAGDTSRTLPFRVNEGAVTTTTAGD
jgi:hypothetical protein